MSEETEGEREREQEREIESVCERIQTGNLARSQIGWLDMLLRSRFKQKHPSTHA